MDKRKVLIIDDEVNFTKMVKLNLEETGRFEVTILSSVKDMLQIMRNFKPDVILLDLLMPGMGGIEACDMLNDDSIGQQVPVIILSALDKPADKLNAYKKGVVDYLVKPIESDELISRIEKVLQLKYGS